MSSNNVCMPTFFLAPSSSYTLDHIFSRWSRKVEAQKQKREEERDRANVVVEDARGEEPGSGGDGGQAAGGSGRRTCLHLFQRARGWVVTSRVGRHGNLLGLPKRGSIVLPVKTARDPDPTGSPTHMDSRSRIAEGGGGDRRGVGFVVPRAEIIGSSWLWSSLDHRTSGCPSNARWQVFRISRRWSEDTSLWIVKNRDINDRVHILNLVERMNIDVWQSQQVLIEWFLEAYYEIEWILIPVYRWLDFDAWFRQTSFYRGIIM